MKVVGFIASIMMLMISGVSTAAEAEGQVFYKMPSGEIVERDVTLEVPARGEGDVILRGENSETRSIRHFTVNKNGKTTFYVIFSKTLEDGRNVFSIFRGAYIRGTNKAVYYGDVYTKSHYTAGEDLEAKGHRGTYAGGFWFKADID